jgi:hypothetical protein
MTISTIDQLVAAARQKVPFIKTSARTTVATGWFSLWDLAGNPGAGTLAVGNTTNGLVPDDTVAGVAGINTFGASATGYLAGVEFASTVACRMMIVDRLFHAGAYAYNAAVTLTAQPSYSARVPGGNYAGLQIWIECVTAFTGNPSVAVTYTNQAGTAARTTGTFATGTALTLGRMMQLPLQAGDTGVQKIESVTATVATAGTFNVLVLRPLWMGRVPIANSGDVHSWDRIGFPQVYDTSCLQVLINADSTSSGIPELMLDVVNL